MATREPGRWNTFINMGNTSRGYSSSFGLTTTSANASEGQLALAPSKSATEHVTKNGPKPTVTILGKGAKNEGKKDSTGPKPKSSPEVKPSPSPKVLKEGEKLKPPEKESKTAAEQKPIEVKSQEVKDHTSKEARKKLKKESNLIVEAGKRSKQRNALPWKDSLSQKERQKLSSDDAILFTSSSKFHSEMLKVHNSYRADHGVQSLKMSKELNREAQDRAEAYLNGETPKSGIPCGENTFTSYFTDGFKTVPGAVQVCSEWYEYATQFDYNAQRKFPIKAVKFMHMVWAAEQEMGSGRATNGFGRTLVVALYRPKAEMPLYIKANVPPPLVPLTPETFHHEHEHKPDQPTVTLKLRP